MIIDVCNLTDINEKDLLWKIGKYGWEVMFSDAGHGEARLVKSAKQMLLQASSNRILAVPYFSGLFREMILKGIRSVECISKKYAKLTGEHSLPEPTRLILLADSSHKDTAVFFAAAGLNPFVIYVDGKSNEEIRQRILELLKTV